LGFFNTYPMRFSFVADHFQYIASVGLLALAAAGIITWLDTSAKRLPALAFLPYALLLGLAFLTLRQSEMYTSHEKLWEVTADRNPDSFIAHNNLGNLVLRRGLVDEAMLHYQRVTQLEPDYEVGHYNLGNVLLRRGRPDLAIPEYQQAVKIAPRYIGAHNNLGNVLFALGRPREALTNYEAAMRLDPNSAALCNNTAKLLATSSDPSVRDGKRAVELAQRAVELSHGREASFIATLGAAFAEAGQFPAAINVARQAFDLAMRQNNQALASVVQQQIALYQSGRPFHAVGNTR